MFNKTIIRVFLGCVFSVPMMVSAGEQCAAITCDCAALPSESWVQTCKNQEARIVASCFKSEGEEQGYCSLHGPMANRLPLDIDVKAAELVASSELPKLSNKVGVLYWAIIQDFDAFETNVSRLKLDKATTKLDTIALNVAELFDVQLQITQSYTAENQDANAQSAWRDYSADTLSFASDFFIRAESMLNSYDEVVKDDQRKIMKDMALRLMVMSGQAFEQTGYAYASGMRHKHAAKAWKNSADAASLILAHTTSSTKNISEPEFYRFQAAARLHRASYHWLIGSGRGGAQESLAESQKFMDDGSSISSLVEEERQMQSAKPFWVK